MLTHISVHVRILQYTLVYLQELVATLGALTYDVQPANKSGDQPVFANESRGFKYYTEIQISRKLQNNQNSRVSVAWTGAVNEDRIYRQVSGQVVGSGRSMDT